MHIRPAAPAVSQKTLSVDCSGGNSGSPPKLEACPKSHAEATARAPSQVRAALAALSREAQASSSTRPQTTPDPTSPSSA